MFCSGLSMLEHWEILSSVYQGENKNFRILREIQTFQEWCKVIKLKDMDLHLDPSLTFFVSFLSN